MKTDRWQFVASTWDSYVALCDAGLTNIVPAKSLNSQQELDDLVRGKFVCLIPKADDRESLDKALAFQSRIINDNGVMDCIVLLPSKNVEESPILAHAIAALLAKVEVVPEPPEEAAKDGPVPF